MSLENSRVWMEYLDHHFDECGNYFRFAMVWMSFNSYYALKYKNIRHEKDQVISFAKENTDLYKKLMGDEFKNILQGFRETGWLFNKPGERDCVVDMRLNSNNMVYFREGENSCTDFFKVLYQIRCNFFHGNKEVSDSRNEVLIRWSYEYLNIFWKKFLENNS